ncbi:hypothetical protein GCM10025866_31490 [Naasia aerilata]|uniref:Maltogenic Amylase C-terminal domain-containing protein n=1 Tax=Naasia aerilata TaxID=1162966 RepID=A0ABM8GFV4_9MICO|nr:hypothetical protein GCM10025866_31490 [Naasia aerilata]
MNPNSDRINAADQVGRTGSVFEWYRRLIALRHGDRLISHGTFSLIAADHPTLFAYLRTLEGRQLLVLANADDEPLDAEPSVPGAEDWAGASVLLDNGPSGAANGVFALEPWQVRVLERRLS